MSHDKRPDLCHGYEEIGRHLGLSARQAKHLSETGQLPTFKLGRIVCSLRSKLDAWLIDRAARASVEGSDE